jgi:AAA+ ATPase superfamily predicted ATPase
MPWNPRRGEVLTMRGNVGDSPKLKPPYANSWRRGWFMNLFDTRPKEDRKLLFGRERELDEIERMLDSGFWPVLIGPPRVGKTSLMKVITKERKGIYIDASTCATATDLGFRLVDELQGGRVKAHIQLDFKMVRIELKTQPVNTLEKIIKSLGDVLIAVDEAQSLNDTRIPALLSVIYNESRVKMMFSGSMLRLIKLITKSPQTLGRPIQMIEVKPFSEEVSRAFLEEGLRRCGVSAELLELAEAVRVFGGIPGWLSYYGAKRCARFSHADALKEVSATAKRVVEEEVKRLGPLEEAIVKALAMLGVGGEWKHIMALVGSFYGKQPDRKSLSRSLKSLVDMRIVEKTGERYTLIDPMYRIINNF